MVRKISLFIKPSLDENLDMLETTTRLVSKISHPGDLVLKWSNNFQICQAQLISAAEAPTKYQSS